jgi:hypothetical protein
MGGLYGTGGGADDLAADQAAADSFAFAQEQQGKQGLCKAEVVPGLWLS